MDKLHREHALVMRMWKFMKACESVENKDNDFWQWVQEEAEQIYYEYSNFTFIDAWLISFMKFLNKE